MLSKYRSAAFRSWFGKGFWAISDQALFALSNFMVLVILARKLPEAEFGAYSVAITALHFACAAHNSLVIEPMLVFGGRRYRAAMRGYVIGLSLGWNTAFTALASILFICLGAGLLAGLMPLMGKALLALALSTPFVLFFWLVRRICYLVDIPQVAAGGGAVYMALMIGLVFLLDAWDALDMFRAILAGGVAAALAGTAMIPNLDRALKSQPTRPGFREVARLHVNYGRWSLGNQSLAWFIGNMNILLMPIWLGFEAVATFKAVSMLVMPLLQIVAALASVALPSLSILRDGQQFRGAVKTMLIAFLVLGVGYGIVLLGAGRYMIEILYGGKFHIRFEWLLLLVATGILFSLCEGLLAALRAIERPDCGFRAMCFQAALLAVLFPLVIVYGTTGALLNQALGMGIMGLMLARMYGSLRLSRDGVLPMKEKTSPV